MKEPKNSPQGSCFKGMCPREDQELRYFESSGTKTKASSFTCCAAVSHITVTS